MASETVLNTISRGTVLEGNIFTKGDIRVEGKIIGTITCQARLVIGEHGVVDGNIDARNAKIGGQVKGKVVVRELLQLEEKGKITGDIFTQKLSVQIGATFSGSCKMGDEARNVLEKAPKNAEETLRAQKGNPGNVVNGNTIIRKGSPQPAK